MLARALDAKVPFAWGTADEAYGQVKYLRLWLETHDAAYVLATRRNDTMITTGSGEVRADTLTARLVPQAWQRISAGAGAYGPRIYDWARVRIRIGWAPERGHWLPARRSVADPNEIAYYVCCGPRRVTMAVLAWAAGSCWHVEECFQQAKNEAGLDHYQARTWRAWYAHITLSMLALAWLSATRTLAVKGEPAPPVRT